MPEKLINTIPHFLSKTWISWVVLIGAMLARMIQLVYFFNIRLDASYQNIATKNLVAGHGISLDKVLPSDLSQTIYEPLINWPPGYSLLLAPFYILFGGDYISAGLTLGIIGALVLIIATRGILRLLDVPQWGINLYTLLAGFYIYYFYLIASSDAITISFFFGSALLYVIINKTAGEMVEIINSHRYLPVPVRSIEIPVYPCYTHHPRLSNIGGVC